MSTTRIGTRERHTSWPSRILDAAMKILPVSVMVVVGAYFVAQQSLRPNQRAIKAALMLALMAFMFRFDMVYSLYLFTLLFPFPSGISIGSSNSVLMTVIPMIWMVRAASMRAVLFRATNLTWPIVALMMAYVLSLSNVESGHELLESLRVIWRQIACIFFFLMIVTFVDNAEKLQRLLKIACISCVLIMLTAVIELIAPSSVIIPGWIQLTKRLSEGDIYTARLEKIRVGGALSSDANLSDFGSQLVCFMAYFAWRSRNPAAKAFWAAATVVTLFGILSTGNRGALIGIAVAVVYGMYQFRHSMSFARLVVTACAAVALVLGMDLYLEEYTYATSPIARLLNTELVGGVPETRTMTWRPSLEKSMEHPFFGGGPWFEIGEGIVFQFWPHNAYLFYLQTLGLCGLGAFLWIMARVGRMSLLFRGRGGARDDLRDLMALAHVWFVVFAIEQIRTDHQRDDIYPYLVWLLFAVISVCARLIQEREGALPAPAAPS
jgi:hypothetical protein